MKRINAKNYLNIKRKIIFLCFIYCSFLEWKLTIEISGNLDDFMLPATALHVVVAIERNAFQITMHWTFRCVDCLIVSAEGLISDLNLQVSRNIFKFEMIYCGDQNGIGKLLQNKFDKMRSCYLHISKSGEYLILTS